VAIEVVRIPVLSDNYVWLVHEPNSGATMVVDPAVAAPVLAEAAARGWQITDIWNAVIVSHDASGYVVGNASYNGTIAHDGETNFGFVATGVQDPSAVHIDLLHV
jgi:hypothetical protein